MDIEFSNIKELYDRLKPALNSKVNELKRFGIDYIKVNDIWNYLRDTKWKISKNLLLCDMVSDILSLDNMIIDNYVKEEMKKKEVEPNLENIDTFYKEKINNFLNQNILKNIKEANIYKEYEFIEEVEEESYHGIIDLMLEYNDHIDIIDYKLKNISDTSYINQLNGYKKYIENEFNKKTKIYLYSILENRVEEVK